MRAPTRPLFRTSLCIATLTVLAACSPDEGPDVATVTDTSAMVDGYVDQSTADYAECLKQAGFTVRPDSDKQANNTIGYVIVEGANFLVGEGEAVLDGVDAPIAVDGQNRDAEIRACYESNPGAKDGLLDMDDFVPAVQAGTPIAEGEVAAGVLWARCARAIGVQQIEDPGPTGYVTIPSDVTLAQATTLGESCSAPMAENEFWPQFDVRAGVKDPETGMVDLTPVAEVLDAPFLASGKMQASQ